MSEMSERARARAKAKAERLVKPNSGAIDASGWREPLGELGEVQTGPRPVSRQTFRRGGKVDGAKGAMRADRRPRKAGGSLTADSLINRDVKEANEKRVGEKHVGGMKRGGRAHKMMGGPMQGAMPVAGMGQRPPMRMQPGLGQRPMLRAAGGKTDWIAKNSPLKPEEMAQIKAENQVAIKKGHAPTPLVQDNQRPRYGARNYAKGGRTHASGCGRAHRDMGGLALPNWADAVSRKSGGKVHADEAQDRKLIHDMGCKCGKCSGGRVGRDAGGRAMTDFDGVRAGPKGASSRAAQRVAESAMKMTAKQGVDPMNSHPAQAENYNTLWKLRGGAPARKSGGVVHKAAGGASYGGIRPAGGRLARKGGGRAKKGMNVNIIIAPSQPKAAMPPPGLSPPPGGGPVGLHQAPPPMPPPGAAPPMGPPPGAMPAARKDGGRLSGRQPAYPIKDGAGGAKGRLEKIAAYG